MLISHFDNFKLLEIGKFHQFGGLMSYVLGTVPQWITKSFPVLESVCLVILAILALALVVLVFMQINGDGDSGNVITGNQDSYYSQNKGGSREGRITKLAYIIVGVIALFCIIYWILVKIPTMF